MNIEINLIIKEEKNFILFINHFKAIKNGVIIKEKKEKDYLQKNELNLKISEIKDIFKNNKHNLLINSNSYINLIKELFEIENVFKLDNIDDYEEDLLEIKNSIEERHKVQHLPDFIYKIEKDEFKKNILLFLISSYFDENQSEIFDFPLFLEMKQKKEIDSDLEVEDFIENLLEKLRSLGV